MKRNFLDILICPFCQNKSAKLYLLDETTFDEKNEIVSGILKCVLCLKIFPIRDRIPCLLTDKEPKFTREAFSKQWALRQAGKFERTRSYLLKSELAGSLLLKH